MASNYFGKKQILRSNLGEIWRIQVQMYLQTYFNPKYGEFNLKNKVSAHGLGLVVQLSWRVAPHLVHQSVHLCQIWPLAANAAGWAARAGLVSYRQGLAYKVSKCASNRINSTVLYHCTVQRTLLLHSHKFHIHINIQPPLHLHHNLHLHLTFTFTFTYNFIFTRSYICHL